MTFVTVLAEQEHAPTLAGQSNSSTGRYIDEGYTKGTSLTKLKAHRLHLKAEKSLRKGGSDALEGDKCDGPKEGIYYPLEEPAVLSN